MTKAEQPTITQGMSAELRAALDRVKDHVMSPEELFEQRVSFVYGQQDWDSPHQKSKDDIRQMLIGSYGYPATRTTSLAAQDGLVDALDDATIDEIILNFAGGIVQVPSKQNPRGYVSYYRPREAMRAALSAIMEKSDG